MQKNITFSRDFQLVHPPKDADRKVLGQIESDAQALAVSIRAGGHKLASVGHAIGKSESYVSRMCSGKRPIPEKLVDPICRATGCNLLRQFRDLQDAMADTSQRREVDRLAALLMRAVA
jgi:DNA-binding transcriptional regulator YdaS (Cro superfamily)